MMEDYHGVGRELLGVATWLVAAVMGRALFVLREAHPGVRELWSKKTFLDLAMAVPMGLMAHGICVYFGVQGWVEASAVSIAAYLGPNIIDRYFEKKIDR